MPEYPISRVPDTGLMFGVSLLKVSNVNVCDRDQFNTMTKTQL